LSGNEIGFFELTRYMAPLGLVMVLLLWGYVSLAFRPEKAEITGLRQRAAQLSESLGPVTRREYGTLFVVAMVVVVLSLKSFVPALAVVDKSAVILCAGLIFFFTSILELKDLESIPWNIILLLVGP